MLPNVARALFRGNDFNQSNIVVYDRRTDYGNPEDVGQRRRLSSVLYR